MFQVKNNQELAPQIHRLEIFAPRIAATRLPGQFVIVRVAEGDERIPLTIADDDGWVRAVRLHRMSMGEPDPSGRRRPVPIEGSDFELPCDIIIVAVGTRANPLLTESYSELKLNRWGNIEVGQNGMTSLPGVFAGGDIVRGGATVILAMGDGKQAAMSIDRHVSAGQDGDLMV